MAKIRAIRYHDFCAGHRVYGHENKCAHLHGHNYRVTFEVEALERLDRVGRVLDFSVIKNRLCEWLEREWDHRFLVWDEDPLVDALLRVDPDGVVAVPFNPTAEHMAQYLVVTIGPQVLSDLGVRLVRCTVEETRKCSASFEL